MKIIKKYDYAISEETLEKDIDKFIKDAKHGDYQFDYKCGMEGLKTIKAYFRMIEAEFKKENFPVARACYKKLIFLLLHSDHNYFDYEDIVGKLNFEKQIANYFICLIKLCPVEELFSEYIQYLNIKRDYDFVSAHHTLLSLSTKENLGRFIAMAENEAQKVREKDYWLYDLIYFLLDSAKFNKDEIGYKALCDKYKHVIRDEQIDFYDEEN